MPYSARYSQEWSNTLYTSGVGYFPEVYSGSVYPILIPGAMRVSDSIFTNELGRIGVYMTSGKIDAGGNAVAIQSVTSMLNSCVYSSNITGTTLNLDSAFTTANLTGTFVISNNVNTGTNLLTSSADILISQNVNTNNLISNVTLYANNMIVAGNFLAGTITTNVFAYQNLIQTTQITCQTMIGDGRIGSNNAAFSGSGAFGSAYGAFAFNGNIRGNNLTAGEVRSFFVDGYANTFTVGFSRGPMRGEFNAGSNGITTTNGLTGQLAVANARVGSNNVVSGGKIFANNFIGGIIGSNTVTSQGGVSTSDESFGAVTAYANNITANGNFAATMFVGALTNSGLDVNATNVFAQNINALELKAGSNLLTMATLSSPMVGTMNCGSNNVTLSTGSVTSQSFYGNVSAVNMIVANVSSSNIVGRIIGSNTISVTNFNASELIGRAESASNVITTGTISAPQFQGALQLFSNTMSATSGNIFVGTRIYSADVQGYTNSFSVKSVVAGTVEGQLLVYTNTIASTSLFANGNVIGPMNCFTNTITASNLFANIYTGRFIAVNVFSEAIFSSVSIGPINNTTGVLSTQANIIATDMYGGILAYNNVIFTQNTLTYAFDQTDMGIFMLPDTSNASTIGRSLSHYISNVNSFGGFWSTSSATPKVKFENWRVPPVNGSTTFAIGTSPGGFNAVYFPGVSGTYMNLGRLPSVNQNLLQADTLVETWVYLNSYTSNNYIMTSAQEGGFENWVLYISTAGRLTRRVRLNALGQLNTATNLSGVIPLNTWTYISVTTLTGGQWYGNVNGNWFSSTSQPYAFTAGPYSFFLGYGGNSPSGSDMYIRDSRIIHGGSLPTTTNYTPETSFGYTAPTYASGGTVAYSFSQEFLPFPSSNGWSGGVTLPDERVLFIPKDTDRFGCYNPKFGIFSELTPQMNAVSLANIAALIKYNGDATVSYGLLSTGVVTGPPLLNLKMVVPFNGSPNDIFGGIVPTVTGTIVYNSVTPKFVQSAIFTNTVNAASPATVYATYTLSPSITSLTFTGYTVACWVKITTNPAGLNNSVLQTIFRFGETTGTAGRIELFNTVNHATYGTCVLARYAATSTGPNFECSFRSFPLTVGTWYHAALVVSRATGSTGDIKVYIEGRQWVSINETVTYTSLMGSFTPTMQIAGQAFNGEIDDFRVYGQPLSAAQVLELYQTTVPYTGASSAYYQAGKIDRSLYLSSPPYTLDAGLVFYTPFDGVYIDVIGGKTPTITGSIPFTSQKFVQNIQVINNIATDASSNNIRYTITSLNIGTAAGFTISFWGYIQSKHTSSSYGSLLGIKSTNANPMYFDIGEGFDLGNGVGLTGRNGSPTPSSNSTTINTGYNPTPVFWHHFCLTCSGGASKLMTLYINAVGTSVEFLNDFVIADIWLGRSGELNSKSFSGQIDDLRIFKDRVFTAAEVLELSQFSPSGYQSPYYNYMTHQIAPGQQLDIGTGNNASIAFWFKDADNLPPNTRQKCVFAFSNTATLTNTRSMIMYYGSNSSGSQYLRTLYYLPPAYSNSNIISNVVTTFTKNEWYHIGLTFSAGTSKLFINGILQDTRTSIANDAVNFKFTNASSNLCLNFNTINPDQGESGSQGYDEFRIYKRALSDTEMFELYQTGSNFITPGTNKWVGGVLLPNGNVVCIPSTNAYVGIYDPYKNIMSLGQNTTGFNGGVLLPNGNVMCVPSSNTFIVEIDPTKQSPTATLNISHGSSGAAPYCFGGCLLPNGKVVLAPASGNAMIYDYRTRSVSNVSGYTTGTLKYSGACFASTGEIILAPGSNAVAVGKISQSGSFSVAASIGSNLSTACPLGNGKILFGTTQSTGAVFDPYTDTLTPVPLYGSYSGAVPLQDGRGLLVPNGSIVGTGLLIGQTPVTATAALSPYLNKL